MTAKNILGFVVFLIIVGVVCWATSAGGAFGAVQAGLQPGVREEPECSNGPNVTCVEQNQVIVGVGIANSQSVESRQDASYNHGDNNKIELDGTSITLLIGMAIVVILIVVVIITWPR